MATATLSATLNTPISGLRLAPLGRILVIEGDSALRKVLRHLFSSEGYEVDVAPDAVCGLERLRQGTPAAVVLDLPRPGSSGCDLCKKIANLIPGLPLVILSPGTPVRNSQSWFKPRQQGR
jgi:DNA-binding response OmpR family regulator